MLTPQFLLPIHRELVVDLFAGGGGASTGIEQAIGRPVDVAVNHDPEAVSLHQANHPQTRHFVSDVFEVDPLAVTDGQPVGLMWASPDCKHFSKAKGGKPVSKKIRSLAWVVIKWAKLVTPRVICLENVEEFQTWGPLGPDQRPCPKRKGRTFNRWKRSLENLGYTVEHKELRACDYGAPTIRKRLFLVARRDGQPIVWPEPTHAAPDSLPVRQKKLQPWRTAAECIDWHIPAPSIFERHRPLAEATCRRIAKGIMRYVVDAAEPFIVNTRNGERAGQQPRVRSIHDPYWTVTGLGSQGAVVATKLAATEYTEGRESQHVLKAEARGPDATDRDISANASPVGGPMGAGQPAAAGPAGEAIAPVLTEHANASSPRAWRADEPLRTQVAQTKGSHFALVAAFMAKHYGGVVGHGLHGEPLHTVTSSDHNSLVSANLVHLGHGEGKEGSKRFSHGIRDIEDPLNTITASGATAGLVTSHLAKLRGDNVGSAATDPVHTISAQGQHHAEVRAFLVKYYGTDQDPRLAEPMHTVPTRDRFGLVMVKGEPYAIVDIGMRMLTPRELYRAQGFPESYQIERGADGRELTKTAQVRMCGNSVCPPLARALVAANYTEAQQQRIAA